MLGRDTVPVGTVPRRHWGETEFAAVKWNTISIAMVKLVNEITDMMFETPRQSDDHFRQILNVKLYAKVIAAFRNLAEDK